MNTNLSKPGMITIECSDYLVPSPRKKQNSTAIVIDSINNRILTHKMAPSSSLSSSSSSSFASFVNKRVHTLNTFSRKRKHQQQPCFRITGGASSKIIIVVLFNATILIILLLYSHEMLFSLRSTSGKTTPNNRYDILIDNNNNVIDQFYTMHGQRYRTGAVNYTNVGGPYRNSTYIQFRTQQKKQYESDWEKQYPLWKRVIYKQWFRKIKIQHHSAFNESKYWSEWLHGSSSTIPVSEQTQQQQQVVSVPAARSNHTVLKLLCITMEEWPWIVHWVVYHGKLIGFENLYILSGDVLDDTAISSTSLARTMSNMYLQHVRDRLRVNVIFSSSNLNQLTNEINEISNNIRPSCNFLMKMDPDEFLSVAVVETNNNNNNHDKTKTTTTPSFCTDFTSGTNCTFTPYHVQEYLDTHLPLLANGTRVFIGYIAQSIPDPNVCNDINTTNDNVSINGIVLLNVTTQQLGLFPVSNIHPIEAFDYYKVLLDARTYKKHDLGGHFGTMIGMFDKMMEIEETVVGTATSRSKTRRILQKSSLGIYHFHLRCVTTEIMNLRKACLSHGYIKSTDPINVVLATLQNKYIGPGIDPCTVPDANSMIKASMPSSHKVLEYAKFLSCPHEKKQSFYPTNTPYVPDQTFYTYLQTALEEYDDWKHISISNSNAR